MKEVCFKFKFYPEVDGGYSAVLPSYKDHCAVTCGNTYNETLYMAQELLEVVLLWDLEDGIPIGKQGGIIFDEEDKKLDAFLVDIYVDIDFLKKIEPKNIYALPFLTKDLKIKELWGGWPVLKRYHYEAWLDMLPKLKGVRLKYVHRMINEIRGKYKKYGIDYSIGKDYRVGKEQLKLIKDFCKLEFKYIDSIKNRIKESIDKVDNGGKTYTSEEVREYFGVSKV